MGTVSAEAQVPTRPTADQVNRMAAGRVIGADGPDNRGPSTPPGGAGHAAAEAGSGTTHWG